MFGSRQAVHHTFFKAGSPAMFPCGGMRSRFCLVWGSGEDLVRSPFAIRQINYNHNSLSYTTLFDFAQYNPTTTKPRPSPHNSAEAASMLSSKLSDDDVWWWQSQQGSNVHDCYTAILFVHFLHTILLKLECSGAWSTEAIYKPSQIVPTSNSRAMLLADCGLIHEFLTRLLLII